MAALLVAFAAPALADNDRDHNGFNDRNNDDIIFVSDNDFDDFDFDDDFDDFDFDNDFEFVSFGGCEGPVCLID
jgi:hypothetical protein